MARNADRPPAIRLGFPIAVVLWNTKFRSHKRRLKDLHMTNAALPLRVARPGKTLRELALEKMREAILAQYFKPGDRLVERDLCEQLGVSRTIVREVLRHLETEGLVSTHQARGPIVSRTTPEEALEIYEIRAALESIAARACAERRDPVVVQRLQAGLDRIKAAYKMRDDTAVLDATRGFYENLFAAAGKTIAWGVVNTLTVRINHLRSLTIKTPGRDKTGPNEMQAMIDAIAAGDGEKAATAAINHMRDASAIAQKLLDVRAVG